MKKVLLLLSGFLFAVNLSAQSRWYVNASAAGNEENSGSSWSEAFLSLQQAIDASSSGDEIWVAKGTYYPEAFPGNATTERDKTFLLPEGIKIYGGFAGTETSVEARMDIHGANETILSGDLGVEGTLTDNAYRVVTVVNNTEEAHLDGFTIKDGYNISAGSGTATINGIAIARQNFASGMLIYGGKAQLNNIVFESNNTHSNGSALYIGYNSKVAISNSIFREQKVNGYQIQVNVAAGEENTVSFDNILMHDNIYPVAQLYIVSAGTGINNVRITNSDFRDNTGGNGVLHVTGGNNYVDIIAGNMYNNTATNGGAMYINAGTNTVNIREVRMYGNKATSTTNNTGGGAMYIGNGANTVNVLNSLLYGNATTATANNAYGGAIFITGAANTLNIVNTTIADNKCARTNAGGYGIYIYSTATPVNIHNSIIWSNFTDETANSTADIQGTIAGVARKSSLVKGYYEWFDNNIPSYLAPGFADAGSGDYSLNPTSPCIDGGTNSLYAAAGGEISTDRDIAGNLRLSNAAGFGDDKIDMGAYEFSGTKPNATEVIYVKATADGTESGLSWNDATSLTSALKIAEMNREITQIWVAAGVYLPEDLPSVIDIYHTAAPITDRDKTFMIPGGVTIYGGFNGTETTPAGRSDIHGANRTILSGDLNNNNEFDLEDLYHVVMAFNVSYYGEDQTGGRNTVLDGITISGGYATTSSTGSNYIYSKIYGLDINRQYGAGMYLHNASPVLNNVIIENNKSNTQLGGGLFITGTTANTDIVNIRLSKFHNNTAASGGAVYINTNSSTVNLFNSLIYDNKATNASIYANGAANTLNVINTTIADSKVNTTNLNGYGIYSASAPVNVYNSIVWSTNSTATTADVQGTGVITRKNSLVKNIYDWTNNNVSGHLPPAFTDADEGDYSLLEDSPCIDMGDNSLYTDAGGNASDKDLAGNDRMFNATGSGQLIDMGAYEFQGTVTLSPAPILYVKAGADDSGSGGSWDDAVSLAKALRQAERNQDVSQIWVAAGTHYPVDNPVSGSIDDRDRTFMIPPGVKIYGGFADNLTGTNGDIHTRDWETNETILSGDFNSDGTDAAYHVVMSFYAPYYEVEAQTERNTVLDGFTVSGGNANANNNASVNGITTIHRRDGAGLYLYNSSIQLNNIIIKDNNSAQFGAGVYVLGTTTTNHLIIQNAAFHTNNNTSNGGAIYIAAGTNNIDIRSAEFYDNTAAYGGALFVANGTNTVSLDEIKLYDNKATTNGGAIYIANGTNTIDFNKIRMYNNTAATSGGALFLAAGTNTLSFLNSLITGNEATSTAGYGGAIYAAGSGTLNLVNTTIAGNKTGNPANGYGISMNSALPVNIRNSIIWSDDTNSTTDIHGTAANVANIKRHNSLVKGYYDWSDNNVPGHLSPAFDADYTLTDGSPCIDAGDNGWYEAIGETSINDDTDLSGINLRLWDASANIAGGNIDMGAFEFQGQMTPPASLSRLYVRKGGAGDGTGKDWDNAIDELSTAISKAETDRGVKEIWVAKGTYSPGFDPVNAVPGRDRTFILPAGVKIYGGFEDDLTGENGNINDRPNKAGTILSGELEDGTAAYHVLMILSVPYYEVETETERNTLLDGFVISGGNANGTGSAVINGQTINKTDGAGIYLYNSSLDLSNIIVKENSATNGAAMYVASGTGRINLLNALIYGNEAVTQGVPYMH